MAHAAEGLYAQNRSPISTLMAMEGLRAFRDALPTVLANPDDLKARGETLYGAWLCGTVLVRSAWRCITSFATLWAAASICPMPRPMPSSCRMPSPITRRRSPSFCKPLFDLLGGETLHQFARRMNAPLALRDLGPSENDLDRAAQLATENSYWNPRPVEYRPIRALLQAAWDGAPPDA